MQGASSLHAARVAFGAQDGVADVDIPRLRPKSQQRVALAEDGPHRCQAVVGGLVAVQEEGVRRARWSLVRAHDVVEEAVKVVASSEHSGLIAEHDARVPHHRVWELPTDAALVNEKEGLSGVAQHVAGPWE